MVTNTTSTTTTTTTTTASQLILSVVRSKLDISRLTFLPPPVQISAQLGHRGLCNGSSFRAVDFQSTLRLLYVCLFSQAMYNTWPVPVVARWVCGRSLAGIAASNPARGMDVRPHETNGFALDGFP
jgi:hypothetical protein